jgi:hypothetical protein
MSILHDFGIYTVQLFQLRLSQSKYKRKRLLQSDSHNLVCSRARLSICTKTLYYCLLMSLLMGALYDFRIYMSVLMSIHDLVNDQTKH